jgi:Cu2+-exporting ATPase
MTALGRITATESQASARTCCLHCGTPTVERFCCAGCATAHALIQGMGLDAFYRRASGPVGALKPDTLPPVPLAPHAQPARDGGWQLDIMLAGLSCGACVWLVEQALMAEPDVTHARAALTTRRLSLRWTGERTRADDFAVSLARLGFRAVPFSQPCLDAADDAETKSLTRALGIATFGAMNVMLVSMAVWFGTDMGEATRALMHWLAALIALPTILVAGRPFFRAAFGALLARRANMDVAISIAVLATAAMSLSEALRNGPYTWFDGATALLALLLAGRVLDRAARARAGRAVAELLALQRASVRRMLSDGITEEVPADQLEVGDRLLLAAGEALPVDAVAETGDALFDLAAVTGESVPRTLLRGAGVPAGAVNMGAAAVVRVTHPADQGSLAAKARMLDAGLQARSRFTGIADKAARIYVPAVLLAALAAFVGWMMLGGAGWREALVPTVSVLIITCPCGLAIAVPAVQAVAVGGLFRRGILVASPTALERLATADHAVLDKTGTLTEGRPVLLPGGWSEDALRRGARLAQASRHPLAQALAHACPGAPAATDAIEEPGQGIRAGKARLGSAAFVGAVPHADDGMAIWFHDGDEAPVRFAFADPPREDSPQSAARLRALGLGVEIASGDRPAAVKQAAREAGIAHWLAEATPADKAARISALVAMGRRPVMVGDGINDAPALAAAHVGASPASGTDLARITADIVLRRDGIAALVEAIAVARRAQHLARQNIGFSLAYNLLAVPLAIAGVVTPLIAAIVMATSSLAVTLNALRAGRPA